VAGESPPGPAPVVLAMLLCDMAITEQGTHKKTLVGIFQRVAARAFPAAQQMTLYVHLTDAQGAYIFRVDIVDIERNNILGTVTSNSIDVPNRLEPFDFVFPMAMLIPTPGLYEFRLHANGAYLSSISFTAQGANP
jgi:Family of unknown function (DUF6941)